MSEFELPKPCRSHGECIFSSFLLRLRPGGFTLDNFCPIFAFILKFILLNLVPNLQKWAENEAEN